MKKLLLVTIAILTLASACQKSQTASAAPESFTQALEQARGTSVTFYGWGGSAQTNAWIDNVLAPSLLAEYGVTLRRVPMGIEDILTKLISEKQAGLASGDIDVVWINGENFYEAKKAGLLFGPIAGLVDNYARYLNPADADLHFDFGTPIEGMEVPYGRAQLVFAADSAALESFPRSAAELLELARANPGQITYPAPPDFTGSAFVRNIIYDIVGFDALNDAPATEADIYRIIRPALDFLVELAPYLWQEGRTYPPTSPAAQQMFVDGQLLLAVSYSPLFVGQMIALGEFPDTVRTFLFDSGNIGNTHYVAVPFNAPNKSAALALINHIISAEMQTTKFDVRNWGDLPVFDVGRLSAKQQATLAGVDSGIGVLSPGELSARRMPEVGAAKIPIIEQLWIEHVLMAR